MRQGTPERAAVAHLGIGDGARRLGQQQRVLADQGLAQDVVVRRHRAHDDGVPVAPHAAELRDPPEVDDELRRRQPQPHDREQALPAGKDLDFPVAGPREQLQGLLDAARRLVVELDGDHRSPPVSSCVFPWCSGTSPAMCSSADSKPISPCARRPPGRSSSSGCPSGRSWCDSAVSPSWMARHTRWGVAGISTSSTPHGRRASTIALITAGVEAMVPASPTPLTPSGVSVPGVSVRSVTYVGTSAALGT